MNERDERAWLARRRKIQDQLNAADRRTWGPIDKRDPDDVIGPVCRWCHRTHAITAEPCAAMPRCARCGQPAPEGLVVGDLCVRCDHVANEED